MNTEDVTYIGYNPNDFFYATANSDQLPSDYECSNPENPINFSYINPDNCIVYSLENVQSTNVNNCYDKNKSYNDIIECIKGKIENGTDEKAKRIFWRDNKNNCFQKEMCKNKKNATKLIELKNNHLGSDQHNINMNKIVSNEYLRLFNYFVGIVVVGNFVYQKLTT